MSTFEHFLLWAYWVAFILVLGCLLTGLAWVAYHRSVEFTLLVAAIFWVPLNKCWRAIIEFRPWRGNE